jgi:hypothetical protein
MPKYAAGEIDAKGRIYVRTWRGHETKPTSKGEVLIRAKDGLRAQRFGWAVEYPVEFSGFDCLVVARK